MWVLTPTKHTGFFHFRGRAPQEVDDVLGGLPDEVGGHPVAVLGVEQSGEAQAVDAWQVKRKVLLLYLHVLVQNSWEDFMQVDAWS